MTKTLAAALTVLLASAVSAQETWDKLEGQHSRISDRRAVAVSDKAAWEKIWKEHSSEAPVPPVDFSKEGVVVVFLGETKGAGVRVDIVVQRDAIDAERLNVFYKEVSPKTNGFTASVICQPYAMVKVPKAKVVAIEVNGRVSTPEKTAAPKNQRDDSKVRALVDSIPSLLTL